MLFLDGNIQLVLLKLAKVSYFTLARFSVASVSCLTGAEIRSTSIEADGINVTHYITGKTRKNMDSMDCRDLIISPHLK